MRGRGGPRFNFPNWNYGYTPGPPAQANGTRPPTRGGTGRGGRQVFKFLPQNLKGGSHLKIHWVDFE